jgi:V/A-type H+-transporting ATPase subunit I
VTALRPASARWFELLTGREQLELALRTLAGTGQVELQAHVVVSQPQLLPQLRAAVDEYHHLAQAYRPYWPPPAAAGAYQERPLELIASGALARLSTWTQAAAPLVAWLQQEAAQRSELREIQGLWSADATLPDLGLLDRAAPSLSGRIYAMDPATPTPAGSEALTVRVEHEGQSYLLALGSPGDIADLDAQLAAHKARQLHLPAGLPPTRAAALQELAERDLTLTRHATQLRGQLEALGFEHQIPAALADLGFAEWLLEHVPELAVTDHFGRITGWTSAPSDLPLETALARAGVQHVLRFPAAPADINPPVLLRNPRWVQPFEIFERLLGIPRAGEADPSVILVVLAPLMFGLMFGDLGQGAVVLLAGLLLRRRFPALALLIPGGIAAMVFGVLFGSVFTREDLLPALWVHPMQQPLAPLAASLALGGCVLLLGLLLDALQYAWAGQSALWWRTRAGLLLTYLGMLGCALSAHALWAVAAGLAWFWLGNAAGPGDRIGRFGAAIGESIETLLQLFVNTLSFVRVGAFALAHAGLAAAVGALAAGTSSRVLALLVLALGNLVVIVIEGLIVSIQTTRLVLFEFFIRFLHGTGRPFRPLPPPRLPGAGPAAPRTLA